MKARAMRRHAPAIVVLVAFSVAACATPWPCSRIIGEAVSTGSQRQFCIRLERYRSCVQLIRQDVCRYNLSDLVVCHHEFGAHDKHQVPLFWGQRIFNGETNREVPINWKFLEDELTVATDALENECPFPCISCKRRPRPWTTIDLLAICFEPASLVVLAFVFVLCRYVG